MDNFTIINLQAILGSISIILGFRIWILPRLANLFWDMVTSILAIIAVIALKGKWKYAIALVWLFNIVGFADLITAFPQFFSLKLYDYDLGTIWLMFVTYGLVSFLSHIYIFIRLIKHARAK